MRDYQMYKKFKLILENRTLCLLSREKRVEHKKFLGMFNYCVNSMKEEYRFILMNSYIQVSYQFWWLEYYCKSSYYRKRFRAVASFLALFEMIYENFNDNPIYLAYA